jgi:hypothetical protein
MPIFAIQESSTARINAVACSGKATTMTDDFAYSTLGKTGPRVYRLGLSGTYRPGKEVIHKAIDAGVNYFFCYGFDGQMTKTLREEFKTRRDKLVVSTGAYNLLIGHPNLRRTLEKRLRQLERITSMCFYFLA